MDSTLDVKYVQNFLNQEDSSQYMSEILTYDFHQYPVKVKGKTFTPSRKICAFGDDSSLNYTFSGLSIPAQPWTPLLLNIKTLVETMCNCSFNYALLNYYSCGRDKIGMHKDNEISLDSNFPIATISLGATRTMYFTRKNFETVRQPLENGSLLVMSPGSNMLWSHGIPAEPKVKEARISITFRKVKPTCAEKHHSEEDLPPAKRQCIDNLFESNALDALFSTVSPSLLDDKQERTSLLSSEETNCETIFKKDIGKSVFLSAELYKGQLKVHIRKYNLNSNGIPYPTKNGVTMELSTWYDFYLKLFNFNLCYTTASYIANNTILVLNMEEKNMYIQDFNVHNYTSLNFIQLDNFQKDTLTESIQEFNDSVIEYLLTKRLSHFIRCERRLFAIVSSEEEVVLLSKLIICLENELGSIFQKTYECEGCIIDHPSQRRHECLMTSDSEKIQLLGDKVLLLINVKAVANKFVNSVDFISENFVNNLSVEIIRCFV